MKKTQARGHAPLTCFPSSYGVRAEALLRLRGWLDSRRVQSLRPCRPSSGASRSLPCRSLYSCRTGRYACRLGRSVPGTRTRTSGRTHTSWGTQEDRVVVVHVQALVLKVRPHFGARISPAARPWPPRYIRSSRLRSAVPSRSRTGRRQWPAARIRPRAQYCPGPGFCCCPPSSSRPCGNSTR